MITTLSGIGAHHRDTNGENQDAVCCGQNRKYDVIALADGVSSCSEAKCGAEIASAAITNLLLKKGEHFFSFDEKQIAELALSHVLAELKQRADADGKDVEAYSSTIACVLVDKTRGKMLCISLGDSLVMAVGGGHCRVVAMPSDSSDGCCVTTTKNAEIMMSVKIFDSRMIDSIMICSDGAWREMFDKNRLKPEVAAFLANHEYENLKTFLIRQDGFDDYSFVALDM